MITIVTSITTLVVSFNSSAYSGSFKELSDDFPVSAEVLTLGVSLYVLGFAVGPLIWGPLSEMYGRRKIFYVSFIPYIAFLAGACGSPNVEALLIFRLLQGTFGASPNTNSGGTIADIYTSDDRGDALSLFSAAVFCGPILGPIVGGFVGENEGWRWTFAVMAFFAAGLFLASAWLVPETYHPTLLRRRAQRLTASGHGHIYKIQQDVGKQLPLSSRLQNAFTRPWRLLFLEPIVTCFVTWVAIIYGTIYLFFEAFPILFQQERGWSEGLGGLAFLGIGVGMMFGVLLNAFVFNPRYLQQSQAARQSGKMIAPEARLPMACVGGLMLPASLFAFAWTSYPSIQWAAPICLSAPFGTGTVLIFLASNTYLIDCFQLWAASALAANSLLRSLFGFAFPLFATDMYNKLDPEWATSLIAFLTLACAPIPFIFYAFGDRIRALSKRAVG